MPDATPVELLRQVSLFAGLAPEHLARLAGTMLSQQFAAGQTIFRQGDAGDCLYVILHGRVRIELLADDGSATTLAVGEAGYFFGEMALLDDKPRSASAVALAPTRALALSREEFHHFLRSSPQAALHILGLLSERLRQNSERLQEVAIGRRIQCSLLAPSLLRWGVYEIRSRSEPATEVGGDFYNLFPLEGVPAFRRSGVQAGEGGFPAIRRSGVQEDPSLSEPERLNARTPDRLALVLGDVAGKGVPAALFMAVTTTLIEAKAQLLISPAATLAAANARLYPKLRPAGERQPRFVTAVYGLLDAGTGELRLSSAGQTPPIYWPAAGLPRYVRTAGLPLGAFPDSAYEEQVLSLSPGDRLLLFSDGFIDEPGPHGVALGYAGFLERLPPLAERNSAELIHALFEPPDPALQPAADLIPWDDRTLMLITAGTSPPDDRMA